VLITSGDVEENRHFFASHRVTDLILIQRETEVSAAYRTNATPSGYLIDAEGKVASELALGIDMVLALANGKAEQRTIEPETAHTGDTREALTRREGNARTNPFSNGSLALSKLKRDGLKAGTPAPDFQLPRVDGRGELSMSALRGRPVLMIFSSPHCQPCNELAPRLEKFHRGQPELEVVMISNGEPDENRAKVKEHGVTFAVALQRGWAISRRYAIFATPAAYLIDRDGIISGDVAVGTGPILDLLAGIARSEGHIDVTAER
jgi:peroxiredoxin